MSAQVGDVDVIPHGYGGYTNHACRCEVCTRANAVYNCHWAQKNRAAKKLKREQEKLLTEGEELDD